ncbi:MAG: hypothetical protein ACK5NK_02105 [Niabella sp.]
MCKFSHIAKSLLLFVCISNFLLLNAQSLEKNLEQWQESNPIQKAYLQLDRENYFAGQTIWFKAYYMSDFLPSAKNSTLFVELLNNQSQVILKKVLPVFGALSYGQLELPDTLSTASYQLRAYTPLMLNQNKNFLFNSRVNIYGKNKKAIKTTSISNTKLNVQFYPEGGNLITGLNNNIAFKIIDEDGFPAQANLTIKNNNGTTITTANVLHNGMGTFRLQPIKGETYSAYTVDGHQFRLPEPTREGIAVQLKNENGKVLFTVQQPNATIAFTPSYMIGQMQHRIVFKHIFTNHDKLVVNGHIPTGNLPSGIMQITLFNKDDMPLAERLVFINNKEYEISNEFTTIEANNGKRKLNEYAILLNDSITGNFSVSVTDADYDDDKARQQNIISSFLLTSDLPGYIHNPAWYFSNAEGTTDALDLVMMTNGWRRFKWTDVKNNTLPKLTHQDKGYISLSGKASVKGSKKTFANRDLMVWVATPDSARSIQLVKTDEQGRFKMDSMIFFDKAKVLFSDVMGKKSKFITVDLDADSLYSTFNIPPLHIPFQNTSTLQDNLAKKMNTAFFDYSRGEGLLLDNVIVKGNKTRLEELESLYMSGLFAGGINARTYDLTREIIPQWNIFEYLQGRVPGLWIERSNNLMGDYKLFYRQGGQRRTMQMYLDEVPMQDASFIASLPTSDIALVKIFPTFVGAPGGGANGVIAIYTKRGIDLDDYIEGTGDIIDYDGYSIMKEFYAPDYSQPVDSRYYDYRLTLNWQPEIYIAGKDLQIPIKFYNNDRTKRFKIIAEGITSNGKLLMVEKIITPD